MTSKPSHDRELLTAADVSKLVGVTPAAVRAMADAGRLACQRTAGGVRLFTRGDVQRVIAQRSARGAACAG